MHVVVHNFRKVLDLDRSGVSAVYRSSIRGFVGVVDRSGVRRSRVGSHVVSRSSIGHGSLVDRFRVSIHVVRVNRVGRSCVRVHGIGRSAVHLLRIVRRSSRCNGQELNQTIKITFDNK